MAKREVLGLMVCPECGYEAAEIKLQKCGVKLYRYCPECNAQFFARTEEQGRAMAAIIAKSQPVTVTPTETPEKAVEQQQKPREPIPVKKKPAPMAGALAFLTGAK